MWAVVNGCPGRLESVENANDLNSILEKFFANVKKRDDKNYEPSSLTCHASSTSPSSYRKRKSSRYLRVVWVKSQTVRIA